MSSLLSWFTPRPMVTALLAAVYYVAVVVSHDLVQELAYWLQHLYSRAIWGPTVAVIACAAGTWASWRAVRVLSGGGRPRGVAAAWWGSAALALAASLVLLATNMEIVHFLQYAILAVPVLVLTRRYGVTVLLIAGLGAFDEMYQWVVLHPGWAVRFDVNDVILNCIGGALGCAAVMVWGGVKRAPEPDARTLAVTWGPLLVVALLLGAGGPALAATHRLAVDREDWCPHTWLTLSRIERPVSRWEEPDEARRHYVVHPGVALAVCLVIVGGFSWLDGRYRSESASAPSTR